MTDGDPTSNSSQISEAEKQQKRREQHRLSARNYRARKKAEVTSMQARMREMASQNEMLLREIQILRARLANGESLSTGRGGSPVADGQRHTSSCQPDHQTESYIAQRTVSNTRKYAVLLSQIRQGISNPGTPDEHIIHLLDKAYCQILGICTFTTDQCTSCPYQDTQSCLCSDSKPAFNLISGQPANHLYTSFYPCVSQLLPQMGYGSDMSTQPSPASHESMFKSPAFEPCINNCAQCPNITCSSRSVPPVQPAVIYPGNLYPCVNNCSICKNVHCTHRSQPLSYHQGNVFPCINDCQNCKNLNCPNRSLPPRIPSSVVHNAVTSTNSRVTVSSDDSDERSASEREEKLSCQAISVSFCQPFLLGKMLYVLYSGPEDEYDKAAMDKQRVVFERWLREQLVTRCGSNLEEAIANVMNELTNYEVQLKALLREKKDLIESLWSTASPYAEQCLAPFAVPFTSSQCTLSPGPDLTAFSEASSQLSNIIAKQHKLLYRILKVTRRYSPKVEAALFLGRHPFNSEEEMLDVTLRMML
ncbi:hypothetical protein P9112_013128 [Eukaryota sp. TZLM1-RC]